MKTLFKTVFGSHLYGTNTPASDTDYKGVYMEPIENIILGRAKDVIIHKTKQGNVLGVRNTSVDVDEEYKELRRFLFDCQKGQTYALDMLFSPKSMWLEESPEWLFIQKNRKLLLSKNVESYIGYCRTQAGKYGLKGSRLGELLRVIEFLKLMPEKDRLIDALTIFDESEYARRVTTEHFPHGRTEPVVQTYFEVLGKKFEMKAFVKDVLVSLESLNAMYGERARMAMRNEGLDWKAISHAFRCCYQLIALAKNEEIVFPLPEADFLKRVKQGEIPYVELQDSLYCLMEDAVKRVESSTLPQKANIEFWNEWVISLYK